MKNNEILNHIETITEKGENGNTRTRDIYEIEGYTVIVYSEETSPIPYDIAVIEVDTDDEYLPPIQFYGEFWSKNNAPHFEIQTRAIGPLTIEDAHKVVKGYEKAIEVIKILTGFFFR